MKVEKISGIFCPNCEEFIYDEVDLVYVPMFKCGECETVYTDRDEAKECCKEWGDV